MRERGLLWDDFTSKKKEPFSGGVQYPINMGEWRKPLRFDPIPPLLSSGNRVVEYFARRDLLEEKAASIDTIWRLPEAQKILHKQLADGSWPHPKDGKSGAQNYRLIETWRQFRLLVDMYGFTRENPQAEKAAEFIFSCQSEDGDIRGFLANQYATYYTGALLSLLIKAGYTDDPRVQRGFDWLLSMRQNDGAWSVALITHKLTRKQILDLTTRFFPPLQPDRAKPFSHNATGMVLRAFAAHPEHRRTAAARKAAEMLASRFFQPDAYTSYHAASYWVKFQFPYWWNHLVAAMDSVTLCGLTDRNDDVRKAAAWFVDHQEKSGLWKTSYVRQGKAYRESAAMTGMKPWIGLSVCRIFKRLYGGT